MNTSSCEQLDDYLVDWLSEIQRSEFEAHLARCYQCRRSVEQQRRIDRLLARGVERLEPVPLSLIDSVERQICLFRRRRAMQLAWGVSTGVVLALLIGVWAISQHCEPLTKKHNEPEVVTRHGDPPASLASQPDRSVQVTLSDRSAAILVPVNTDAPNVSIVWIYPTLKPARVSSRNEVN